MCFYLSIFLVNNTIFCKDYCCECCEVCCYCENDNEESKNKNYEENKNYEGNKNILIQTIEKYILESKYSYIYKMMRIAIKDIKVEFNYGPIKKNIQEQEDSGEPSLLILFECFYLLMDKVKMLQEGKFNEEVVDLLRFLFVECEKISNEIGKGIQEDKQQLNSLVTSLEEIIINGNIDFIKFSEPNIEKLYTYIKNSLQAIYEKKQLHVVIFHIKSLIEHINKNCEGLNEGLKEEENNEKKLINLSKNFDQKFFNNLKFNNKDIKDKRIKKEEKFCFYHDQKIKINDIKYQQMIIPGDGNCLLYSILAFFDSFACYKDEFFHAYIATEESKKNADIFRERLLMSTLDYVEYVLKQLKTETDEKKKDGLNAILACLNNIGNDLSGPNRFIDVNCLMIIAKYFEVDICLYIETNNSFLYFNKKGSLPESIIGQDFNQKDGIKLIMINNNHYELLRK